MIHLHPSGAVIDGELVGLTRREQALFSWLLAHTGDVQSRETLLREVWGYSPGARSRTVESTMSRLRAKLEAIPRSPVGIRTVRGDGWVLDASLSPAGPPFVGRSEELGLLERWLGGAGTLLTLTGPPGIGKSALVGRCPVGSLTRIDAADIRCPDDWFRTLEAHGSGVLWLDDADLLVPMLRTTLPARIDRRLVVTSRQSVRRPDEEVVLLGSLSEADTASLARRLLERWFPSARWQAVEVEQLVARSEGNPLVVETLVRERESSGDGAARARVASRSLDRLPPDRLAGLGRLAALPVVVPHALAERLVEDPGALADLRERSLVCQDGSGGWRVPAVVRLGLEAVRESSSPFWPTVTEWVVDRVSTANAAGDARWRAFLSAMEPERPLLYWTALHCPDARGIWWATVALDDQAVLSPRDDLMPVLDRAVAVAGSAALLRRAREHRRLNDNRAAEADVEAAQSRESTLVGTAPRSRTLLFKVNGAFHAGQFDLAERLAREALALAEEAGEPNHEAMSHSFLADIASHYGDHEGALRAARAARAALVGGGRFAGQVHSSVVSLAGFLLSAGRDDEARDTVEESSRMAFDEESRWHSDSARAWIDVVTGADPEAVDRLGAFVTGAPPNLEYAFTVRVRHACAEVAIGALERGLSDLRTVTAELVAAGRPALAGWARPFAIAGRVGLGLEASAPWMPCEPSEGDPAIQDMIRGFEALARGDRETASSVSERCRSLSARARLLRIQLANRLA